MAHEESHIPDAAIAAAFARGAGQTLPARTQRAAQRRARLGTLRRAELAAPATCGLCFDHLAVDGGSTTPAEDCFRRLAHPQRRDLVCHGPRQRVAGMEERANSRNHPRATSRRLVPLRWQVSA